jgi:serine/threonine protein kinase
MADEDKYDDDFEDEKHTESPKSARPPPTAPAQCPVTVVARVPDIPAQHALSSDSSDGWAPIDPKELDIGPQLGGGGFAVVYKGSYRGTGVAVKMIVDPAATPAQLDDFMAELHTMASVSGHRNIVKLVGASPSPPRQCIVMELCRCSLYDVLQGPSSVAASKVPIPLRIVWALDVAQALAYLHARRPAIIHRDIKRLVLGVL